MVGSWGWLHKWELKSHKVKRVDGEWLTLKKTQAWFELLCVQRSKKLWLSLGSTGLQYMSLYYEYTHAHRAKRVFQTVT